MQKDKTNDQSTAEQHEVVYAYHHDEFYKSDPGWEDVPELTETTRQDLREAVADVVPGVLENAARQRYAILTTLGCQYVRYRRAGCNPEESRHEAIKRTGGVHDVSTSAVYEHVRALPIEEAAEITPYLEQLSTRYHCNLSKVGRALEEPCRQLRRVLSAIAAIDDAPGIDPADITLQDVYRDQPGKRSRVLTADRDGIGLPRAAEDDRGASVTNAEMGLDQEELETMSQHNPIHLSNDAKIFTRDIATYDTEYSRVLRTIFEAVQAEMTLYGKQKPGPVISTGGDDNAAVRAIIPYPESVAAPDGIFARLRVQYWEDGYSEVHVTTHPLGRIYDEKDPCLSGPIEKISHPGIHALIGKTIAVAEQEPTARCVGHS